MASFLLFYKVLAKILVFTLANIAIQSLTLESLYYKGCYTNVIQIFLRFFSIFDTILMIFLISLWPIYVLIKTQINKFKGLLNMKKSTNHDTRLVLIDTIISYSTILYHIIVDSQYVTNVIEK